MNQKSHVRSKKGNTLSSRKLNSYKLFMPPSHMLKYSLVLPLLTLLLIVNSATAQKRTGYEKIFISSERQTILSKGQIDYISDFFQKKGFKLIHSDSISNRNNFSNLCHILKCTIDDKISQKNSSYSLKITLKDCNRKIIFSSFIKADPFNPDAISLKQIKASLRKFNYDRITYDSSLIPEFVNKKPDPDLTIEKVNKLLTRQNKYSVEGTYRTINPTTSCQELLKVVDLNDTLYVLSTKKQFPDWQFLEPIGILDPTQNANQFFTSWLDCNKKNHNSLITFKNNYLTINSLKGSNYNFSESYLKVPEKTSLTTERKTISNGTGFFVSKIGHITTNYHVVANADSIFIFHKSKFILCDVVAIDSLNDLAIIKARTANYFLNVELPYTISEQPQIGEEVFTLGYPIADILGARVQYSRGSISSIFGPYGDKNVMTISNPIQHGNSGGPLFNTKGELLGIISSKLIDYSIENIGFSVKASTLKQLMQEHNIDTPRNKKVQLENDLVEQFQPFVLIVVCVQNQK